MKTPDPILLAELEDTLRRAYQGVRVSPMELDRFVNRAVYVGRCLENPDLPRLSSHQGVV